MFTLQNKTALVTGASRGIGRATAAAAPGGQEGRRERGGVGAQAV